MAGFKREDVVGPGKSTIKPTPKASAAPKIGAQVNTDVTSRINQLLQDSGLPLSDYVAENADAGIVDTLSTQELVGLGMMLNQMGYNFKSPEAVRTALIGGDFPEASVQKDYKSLVKYIRSQEIPSMTSTGPSVTQTITQYDDKYLTSVANNIAQDFLGRNLEPGEAEKILPKLRDIANKGTTTTSKKVGGKNVVTTTPGFSTAAAQDVVQTELRLGASEDLQAKQYVNFADWLSKNMAGM